MINIGIGGGGTFTDSVVEREGPRPLYFKTASTPDDPSIGVMQGLEDVADAL
ncbi:MAG: hydantoinase/oxoprolinase N-terminal domain-containing protein [Gemmatimonadota bacterium]|nr:hydantoinase/oxoprolinase N-terminal domain-containing protein [Gemmatimonadota bacterium]